MKRKKFDKIYYSNCFKMYESLLQKETFFFPGFLILTYMTSRTSKYFEILLLPRSQENTQ